MTTRFEPFTVKDREAWIFDHGTYWAVPIGTDVDYPKVKVGDEWVFIADAGFAEIPRCGVKHTVHCDQCGVIGVFRVDKHGDAQEIANNHMEQHAKWEIHHLNGNPSNNTIENLVLARPWNAEDGYV